MFGLHWQCSGGIATNLQFSFQSSIGLLDFLSPWSRIGSREDKLDLANACWRIHKLKLFNSESGRRQILGWESASTDFRLWAQCSYINFYMLQQLNAYSSELCFNILLQVTRLGSDGDDLCLKHLTFVFEVLETFNLCPFRNSIICNWANHTLTRKKFFVLIKTVIFLKLSRYGNFCFWGWFSVHVEATGQFYLEK